MKIGLIAMSGVRVHNPQLMELGLTLPGFVVRSKVIASLPSLALLTLAGMTPAAISLEYLEVPDLGILDHLPGEFDAVAIASYTAMIGDAYTLADRYRSEGTRVILGGLHVTAMPQEALQHADAVVLGEAEPVWLQVLHDMQAGLCSAFTMPGGWISTWLKPPCRVSSCSISTAITASRCKRSAVARSAVNSVLHRSGYRHASRSSRSRWSSRRSVASSSSGRGPSSSLPMTTASPTGLTAGACCARLRKRRCAGSRRRISPSPMMMNCLA